MALFISAQPLEGELGKSTRIYTADSGMTLYVAEVRTGNRDAMRAATEMYWQVVRAAIVHGVQRRLVGATLFYYRADLIERADLEWFIRHPSKWHDNGKDWEVFIAYPEHTDHARRIDYYPDLPEFG